MCNVRKLCFKLDFFSVTLGELTETNGYIINLIILVGKIFIFEAAGVDFLNISHFRMLIKRFLLFWKDILQALQVHSPLH